jgi:hypothetical protein
MTINDLLKDLVISEAYKNQILKDKNVQNYINNKVFDSVFNGVVELLKPFSVVRRKFIKGYTDQADDYNGKNLILFSPLQPNSGNAIGEKWIARMPLQQNNNQLLVYFPRDIVVANEKLLRFEDKPDGTQRFRYAIPKDINKFIENPSAYISLAAVKSRLSSSKK